MIDAAIACMLERGFYRASSNEIARRAGLTWGAIQRQFGTREALLLAAYEDGTEQLLDILRDARITGQSSEEKLDSLFEVLGSFYNRPEFLAYLQIAMNFLHDPATSDQTLAIIRTLNREGERLKNSLAAQVLGPSPGRDQDRIMTFLYLTVRDFWIGLRVEEVTTVKEIYRRRLKSLDAERKLLVRALVPLVESGAAPGERKRHTRRPAPTGARRR